MTKTNTQPSAISTFLKKEQEFAATAATLCGVLSVVGLASAATLEWIKALQIEPAFLAMYKTDQFHAAATNYSFSAWIVAILVISAGMFFHFHKFFVRRHKSIKGHMQRHLLSSQHSH